MGQKRTPRRLAYIALITFPVLLFCWNSLYYTPWTVDDAFISLRYAQNLADGNGLMYNQGERIEGYSNFTWVLLAALLIQLGLPYLTLLKVAGLVAGVSILFLSYRLSCRIGGEPDGRTCGIISLWFLGCNASLAIWCQSGLETTLFAALIVGMCLRFEIEMDSKGRWPWSALLFALAWMTRPEAPIYGLYFLIRRGRNWFRPQRADWMWLTVLFFIVVPYELWGFAYFGHWLPQTHAAKIDQWTLRNLVVVPRFLFGQGVGFLILLVAGFAGAIFQLRRVAIVLWVPLFAGLVFTLYAGPDWMPRYRLMVPVLAMIGSLIALGCVQLIRTAWNSPILLSLTVLLLLLAGADYARQQMTGAYRYSPGRSIAVRSRAADWWLQVPSQVRRRDWPLEMTALTVLGHVDPGARIVLKDFGFAGFLSMNPVWDLAGLVTPATVDFREGRHDPEVRNQYIRQFKQSGGASHIFISGENLEHLILLDDLFRGLPGLRGQYEPVDAKVEWGAYLPKRFERLTMGLPACCPRVWRDREVSRPNPEEVLANLEARLPSVVKRFPEYHPRMTSVLAHFRQYLKNLDLISSPPP